MRTALQDPLLRGHVMLGESWSAWRMLLISAMGEKLTDSEREIFTRMTGREHEPEQRVSEFACGVGRRGGKSSAIGAACAYIGGLHDHPALLAPAQRGVPPCLPADSRP